MTEADNLPCIFNPNALERKKWQKKIWLDFSLSIPLQSVYNMLYLEDISGGGCGLIIFPIKVFMCLKFIGDQ